MCVPSLNLIMSIWNNRIHDNIHIAVATASPRLELFSHLENPKAIPSHIEMKSVNTSP